MRMATKKNDDDIVKEVVKKPRGGKNSPVIGDNGIMAEPGDNTKYLTLGMKLFNLPPIDLKDPEQVNNRLMEFFQIHAEADMKPTVSGMGMALGLDRRRLWEIKTGNFGTQKALSELPTLTKDSIKRAYEYMEILWENYMQNGKINPVSGIFLGKNNFGYQDKTEYVVTPNVNNDSDYNADDIRKRYLTDSADSSTFPTIDSPDSDSDF
jgi:hypothetical protein